MPTTPKKNGPASAEGTSIETEAPETELAVPRAVFIMRHASREDPVSALASAEAAPEPAVEAVVAPRAVFVMHRAAADSPPGAAMDSAAPEACSPPAAAESAADLSQAARAEPEKGVGQSRAPIGDARTAFEEGLSALENGSAAARDYMLAIQAKSFEALRAQVEANGDFAKAALGVKSLPDLLSLESEWARKQAAATIAQARDVQALALKAIADALGPRATGPIR